MSENRLTEISSVPCKTKRHDLQKRERKSAKKSAKINRSVVVSTQKNWEDLSLE